MPKSYARPISRSKFPNLRNSCGFNEIKTVRYGI